MTMRQKIAQAIETADCHSLGFVDRATDAILNILNEYGEEEIEAVAMALLSRQGFAFYTDPMEGGQDAYDISLEAKGDARAAIKAFLGTLS